MQRPTPASLPATPGVYLYKDSQGRIIYVGKARNLRKRILSYFRDASALTPKTAAMIGHAASLDTLSTGTEKEALLLEASLIKKHRPRYNIVLRDDKEYVLFRINRKADYPRLEVVRQAKSGKAARDRALYFGPFTSGLAARETWKSIHRAFPLRRCTDRAFKNRIRPCLYFHLGQCLAPCTEEVPAEKYEALIHRVELLLSGRSKELLDSLRAAMLEASETLDFERAAVLRDQIRAVERTLEKQSVVLPEGGNMDVAGLSPVAGGLGLGLLFIREGRLMDGRTFFWPDLTLADGQETVWTFLTQFYGPLSSVPPRIVVPWLPVQAETGEESGDDAGQGAASETDAEALHALEAALTDTRGGPVRIALPRNAAEAHLVDMAVANAREAALSKREPPMGERLARVFHREESLRRIECVDVSHTGGSSTRIGMVVFEDGQPLKSAYRTYALRPEDGELAAGDDYAALAVWMRRRLQAGPPWADLVLIDGGRGQVSAVFHALSTWLGGGEGAFVPGMPAGLSKAEAARPPAEAPFLLAGIAKARDEAGKTDRRAGNVSDRIFLPGRSNPLPLHEGSAELLFLQHVRDTAHHYVIGRHRRARAGAALTGELMRLPGVGKATAQILWTHLGSLEAMVSASPEDLAAIPGIGPRKARLLAERLGALAHKKADSAPDNLSGA